MSCVMELDSKSTVETSDMVIDESAVDDTTKEDENEKKDETDKKEEIEKKDETDKKDKIDKKDESVASTSADGKGTDLKNVRIVRGTKRMRPDSNEPGDKKESKEDAEAEAKIMRSLKRSCELWSMEDKNTFFKAINEFGKDFDALQSYFLIQGKKKGLPEKMIKNKEQIRHFYYRTWLKISKHLKFAEDVKKTTQELYGLINYGELRRKLPRMHEKVQMKLNELVYWGSTQVRLRGKTMRIKTPICRALRKLNQLEGWQEDIKLPSRVTIELRPGDNLTWWHVQALSMNPRVRTLVPIQRRLSSILTFLQQRWRPCKYKTSDLENLSNDEGKDSRLLRVAPPEGCKIALPVVNLGEYLTSNSVSLNSYEKRLGLKSSRLELLGSMQYIKGVGKKAVKKYKSDKRQNNRTDEQYNTPADSDVDFTESNVAQTEKLPVSSSVDKITIEQPSGSNGFPGRETVERIRMGWNVEESNTITVGDLLLMFGRDSKITLEYWWEPSARDSSTENCGVASSQTNNLALALQKLLSIAKLSYGTSKGYDHLSGSNETIISSRIPSTKESTFRRPLIPQAYHKMGAPEAFKTQLDKYKSRSCRRGRILRQRSLVVQRVLPITPEVNYPETSGTANVTEIPSTDSVVEELTKRTDADSPQKHFLDVLARGKPSVSNSSITSAMQILKEGEQQWLNCEVADFSLSSFLGQLESPIKSSQRSQTEGPVIQGVRPPSDVVTHMQCLMGENSVDYMAKFANLASQMVSSDDQKK